MNYETVSGVRITAVHSVPRLVMFYHQDEKIPIVQAREKVQKIVESISAGTNEFYEMKWNEAVPFTQMQTDGIIDFEIKDLMIDSGSGHPLTPEEIAVVKLLEEKEAEVERLRQEKLQKAEAWERTLTIEQKEFIELLRPQFSSPVGSW